MSIGVQNNRIGGCKMSLAKNKADRLEYSSQQLRRLFYEECEKIELSFDDQKRPRHRDTEIPVAAVGTLSIYLNAREIRRLAMDYGLSMDLDRQGEFAEVVRSAISLRAHGLGIVQREEAIIKEERLRIAEKRVKELELELNSANEKMYQMRRSA